MATVVFALYLNIDEICTNQKQCQKSGLENEGQCQLVEKWDLRHSTGNVQFYICDFFPEFQLPGKGKRTFMQKGNTHTHTKRDMGADYRKICKRICLKTENDAINKINYIYIMQLRIL